MRRGRGRTIYVRIRNRQHVEQWLSSNCVASTGPYPNITGMRNLYWGHDCLIVRAGAYIYNMGRDVGQEIPQ